MMMLLIEKRGPLLIKVKKNVPIQFEICVITGNGSRVVVSHQIFFIKFSYERRKMIIFIILVLYEIEY